MKWITHQAVAVGAAYTMGMPMAGLAGVAVGSVLPDVLDQGIARLLIFRQQAFKRIHRGATHWFGWWLALFIAAMLKVNTLPLPPEATLMAMGIGFGALAHVLLDMCTVSGVPVAPWTKKHMISLKLCSTGSVQEYAFLGVVFVLFAFLARQDLLRLASSAKRYLPM